MNATLEVKKALHVSNIYVIPRMVNCRKGSFGRGGEFESSSLIFTGSIVQWAMRKKANVQTPAVALGVFTTKSLAERN